MGRDIVLPLRPYEERINLALKSAWEQKSLSIAEAAKEFIVSTFFKKMFKLFILVDLQSECNRSLGLCS